MNTNWEMQSGDRMIFNIYITGMRLFFLTSAVIWIIRAFTDDDDARDNVVHHNGNGIKGGDEMVKSHEKENSEKMDVKNIELAKKLHGKKSAKGFNIANITASLIFLVSALIVTYVLYFIRLESCNQLINMAN